MSKCRKDKQLYFENTKKYIFLMRKTFEKFLMSANLNAHVLNSRDLRNVVSYNRAMSKSRR